jgi:endonuclease I
MKKLSIYAALLLLVSALKGQATLPASWDMSNINTPPTGWSYDLDNSGTQFIYTGAGLFKSAPQALRFDGDLEFLMVNFSGIADTVQYYIRHSGISGQDTGIFTVQESSNGTTWSTVKEYKRSLPNTLTLQTVRVKPSSRYVRFYFTDKVSGYNVALDDVVVKPGSDLSKPQVSLQFYKELVNGQTLQVGQVDSFDITIKNKSSVSDLDINSANWSGSQKAFFSVKNMPTTLSPLQETQFRVVISGAPAGSVKAKLTINSNDSAGNGKFDIDFYAIKGALATEPAAQVSNLRFSEVKPWRMKLNATNGGLSEQVLVLVKANAPVTEVPVDGASYERGEYIGAARVMWAKALQEITLDKIYANTRYYVKVFAFNGYETYTNYNTSNPAGIDSLTPGLQAGNYYDGISSSDTLLVSKLRAKVRPHFQVFYSNYGGTVGENFEAYDTTKGKRVITCYYSGYKHVYVPPIVWDTITREHSYPSSWMGESSKDSSSYSDLHILFPVHQAGANAVRSNFPLNNLKSVTFTFLQGKLGLDSVGNVAYEPRDAAKGVASRAAFYVCAAYNHPGKPFTIPTSVPFINELQDQNVLKRWNQKFPPSGREIARHEYVASVQNNRNPFVDHPEWACNINFSNMTYMAAGNCFSSAGVKQPSQVLRSIALWPNPATSEVQMDLSAFSAAGSIEVFDINERRVIEQSFVGKSATLQLGNLQAGQYLVLVRSGNEIAVEKLIRN